MLKKNVWKSRECRKKKLKKEWIGSNPDVQIISEERTTDYHTYGTLQEKAYGYKKIIYKNIYPGVDVVYTFTNNNKPGFEYSLLVKPGADLSVVKLKYGGNVKTISTDNKGSLIVRSDIDGISSSIPISYYSDRLLNKTTSDINSDLCPNDSVRRGFIQADKLCLQNN
jgi:hypothetical protein